MASRGSPAAKNAWESLRRGYRKEVVLEDFYAEGDGKVIYVKVL